MLRNILLPVVFVLLPLALTNGVPRLATQEIKGLHFAVVDNDRSTTTQRLIQEIDASTYLDLSVSCSTYDDAMRYIDSGEADVIIEFPQHYSRDLAKAQQTGRAPQVMISANSTNGTKGTMASMYITQILLQATQANVAVNNSSPRGGGEGASMRFLFNQKLDYKLYMVPAILGLILILIVGFLPALNIVSEKEKGTIEQINVTPVRKWEFIASKIVPYIVVGVMMIVEGLLVAKGAFGFWPQGSIALIFLLVFIFCMLVSSFGLIISNYSSTIQQAALTMFFFLVIFLLMSGLLTPIQSMPDWAQAITYANPLRYFVECIRAIYIKGATLTQLSMQFSILTAYTCLTWTWAIISYRKNS